MVKKRAATKVLAMKESCTLGLSGGHLRQFHFASLPLSLFALNKVSAGICSSGRYLLQDQDRLFPLNLPLFSVIRLKSVAHTQKIYHTTRHTYIYVFMQDFKIKYAIFK